MNGPQEATDAPDLSSVPLFPLPSVVLFPRAVLPLHIFEPRYQAMIADLLPSTPPAFGVLSIHRGIETSENVAFAAVGTMAEIVNRRPYPDGTSDLLTIGSRRFRVREVLRSGRPYLRAEVEWLPETVGTVTPELMNSLIHVPVVSHTYRLYSPARMRQSMRQHRELLDAVPAYLEKWGTHPSWSRMLGSPVVPRVYVPSSRTSELTWPSQQRASESSARAISLVIIQSVKTSPRYGPSPRPPYSRGTVGACSPAAKRSSKSSSGKVAVRS